MDLAVVESDNYAAVTSCLRKPTNYFKTRQQCILRAVPTAALRNGASGTIYRSALVLSALH